MAKGVGVWKMGDICNKFLTRGRVENIVLVLFVSAYLKKM